MAKLKREIFARPTRMTHRFGSGDDPLASSEYFDMKPPLPPRAHTNQPLSIKDKGLYTYTEPLSPVAKFRGGDASLNGPKPDYPDAVGERTPVSTKRRKVTAGAE